jgi:hypothetical protein
MMKQVTEMDATAADPDADAPDDDPSRAVNPELVVDRPESCSSL